MGKAIAVAAAVVAQVPLALPKPGIIPGAGRIPLTPFGLPLPFTADGRATDRATEAIGSLQKTSPDTLHGLLDHALRIARELPFVPNGGRVSSDRTSRGDLRAVISLESLGNFRLGDERLAITVDTVGTLRAAVLDGQEMRLREVGELGRVSRFVGPDGVSVARFPTLAEIVAPGLTTEVQKAQATAPRMMKPASTTSFAPTPDRALPPSNTGTSRSLPAMETLGRIRDAEAARVVQQTYAIGYGARLEQLRGVQTLVFSRGLVTPGQLDGLERAGQHLDKLRDRAHRVGQLAGLAKVLETVASQGIRQVTDVETGRLFYAEGLERQIATVNGEATAAAKAFDAEMKTIGGGLTPLAMPTITRLPPELLDPNAGRKIRGATLPPELGVNLPAPRPAADPRASDPPPSPGRETGQREKPLTTPRDTIDAHDLGSKPFPPFPEEKPLSVPVPPEAGGDTPPVAGSTAPQDTFEMSPRAARDPHVWPGLDLDALLEAPDLSPGQREFLTYLNSPEGQSAFRDFAAMSRPWSDNREDRLKFVADASQKIRQMSLMGTGSKSQAELAFVIYGSRDGGMRVFPEIRVGSPNSVVAPRGLKQLLSDPKVDLVVDMHTHPALGPELINGAGDRVNIGSPVTGFSQADFRAMHARRKLHREWEQETGLPAKMLEFGNVTSLGGTVAIVEFNGDNITGTRIIGAAGGVLEDGFSIVPITVNPGLALPPRGSSKQRQDAIQDAQGYPNGLPGLDAYGRRRRF